MRALLLGVAVAGGCAVYEVPPTSGVPAGVAGRDNGFGGSNGGDGSGAEQAEPNSGGQLLSVAAGAGNAGASDGDGGFPSEPVSSGGAPTGSVGEAGQGGEGGLAGASGWGGEPAGAGGSTHCAARWRTQSTCEDCATQVQPDLQECAVVLDCYVDKNCGPSSCANPDQKCGTNILRLGAAAYRIAQTVYDCLCQ